MPGKLSLVLALAIRAYANVGWAGVNIAGCDFGCDYLGTCKGEACPVSQGPNQIAHFHRDDHLNIFRIPVAWQALVNYQLGGPLDANFFENRFNPVVSACLETGGKCIIDIHNYGRWNNQVIGQSSVTDDDFVSVWEALASQYAGDEQIVFGIMNEPHDLDMTKWAATVQKVVTMLRNSGAKSQWILLPGTNYTTAQGFETYSAPYLSNVKNPDGTTTNLIYDIHKYCGVNGNGKYRECATNNVATSFTPLATYLRQHKRQALLTETGGGNTPSCIGDVCSELSYLNSNSDVYLGWVGWGAGSFDATYNLTETPTGPSGTIDTPLVATCIAGKFTPPS